jgi:hypothetical protein
MLQRSRDERRYGQIMQTATVEGRKGIGFMIVV